MASSYPRILYNNKLLSASVTASSEATGFQIENAIDWRDYTYWKAEDTSVQTISCISSGGNVDFNCLAFSGHNLVGATLNINISNDGITWSTYDSFTVNTSGPVCRFFTTINTQFIQIVIPLLSEVATIGILYLGDYLEIPSLPISGFNPDQLEMVMKDSVSDYGRLLGRVKKYVKRSMDMTFQYLSRVWCDTYYIPFWRTHADKPFFLVWNYAEYPTAVYLVRFTNPVLNLPFDNTFRTLSLSVEGLEY